VGVPPAGRADTGAGRAADGGRSRRQRGLNSGPRARPLVAGGHLAGGRPPEHAEPRARHPADPGPRRAEAGAGAVSQPGAGRRVPARRGAEAGGGRSAGRGAAAAAARAGVPAAAPGPPVAAAGRPGMGRAAQRRGRGPGEFRGRVLDATLRRAGVGRGAGRRVLDGGGGIRR